MCRSYRGLRALSCRMTKVMIAAIMMAASQRVTAPLPGTGAKLIARTSAPTNRMDRRPPRLSTGLSRLVDVGRHEGERHRHGHDGKRHGDQEHRPPPEPQQQCPTDQRAQHGDGAAETRPQGDRPGAPWSRPQGRDHRERCRVGHARREPAENTGGEKRAALLARRRRTGTPGPTAPRQESASACGRSGRQGHPGTAPSRPGRVSTRRRLGRGRSATNRTLGRWQAAQRGPRRGSGSQRPPPGSAR